MGAGVLGTKVNLNELSAGFQTVCKSSNISMADIRQLGEVGFCFVIFSLRYFLGDEPVLRTDTMELSDFPSGKVQQFLVTKSLRSLQINP